MDIVEQVLLIIEEASQRYAQERMLESKRQKATPRKQLSELEQNEVSVSTKE